MTPNRMFGLLVAASALALTACSEADSTSAQSPIEIAQAEIAPAQGEMAASTADAAGPDARDGTAVSNMPDIAVSLPQLAYSYDLAFALPGENLRRLQRQHADLCEQQGPQSCQIAGMSTQGEEEGAMHGELQLLVATRHARAFGALLEAEAEAAGAQALSANVATEEVSASIIDTQAELTARTELRDRLREVLRTRQGTVEELIAAERGVAEVNAEIDRARALLADTQNRVAMSRMTVRYEGEAALGSSFLDPVSAALGSVSTIFGVMLAGLILLLTLALPVGLVMLAIRRLGGKPDAPTA